jgi:hypothetical protein
MNQPYRTAFNNKKEKDPVEYNLDKVVNMATLKLKEMINTKHEIIRETNLLRGQRAVLDSDIAHYEKEVNDKETLILKMNEEYLQLNNEIQELENELKEMMYLYNDKNDAFKQTINSINYELDSITITNGVEENQMKKELKQEYENYLNIKNENKDLVEKLHQLRRDLYYMEVFYIYLDKLQTIF